MNESRHQKKKTDSGEKIVFNFDGLCEPRNPAGIATYGVIIKRGSEIIFEGGGLADAKPWSEESSNNVAEYSALIQGLQWLKNNGLQDEKIVIRGDSKLVVNQMKGIFKVKANRILRLFQTAKKLISEFHNAHIEWTNREANSEADLLSRIAYSKFKKLYPRPYDGHVDRTE